MNAPDETAPAAEPIVRIVRMFDAPVDVVYRAWTDPAQMAQWWGPHGFDNPTCELDPRPGGRFYIVMRGPDGSLYPCVSTFRDVVPNVRLIYQMRVDPNHDRKGNMPPECVHEITFEAVGARTKLTVIARLQTFEGRDKLMDMGFTGGMGQSLEKLAAIVSPAVT